MHLTMLSVISQPFCLGLNVLKPRSYQDAQPTKSIQSHATSQDMIKCFQSWLASAVVNY